MPNARELNSLEHDQPTRYIHPRYWISKHFFDSVVEKYKHNRDWLLGFRDVTNNTNERTFIASVIPRTPATRKFPTVGVERWEYVAGLAGNFSAYIADYVARQKIGGTSMSFYVFKQLPILPPQTYQQPCPWPSISQSPNLPISAFLLPRILELTYTAYDLRPFAQDCGYHGPPFRWNEERRFLLRCELDAAYFHLYGIARDDVAYIMDTFPIVRRKDEAAHGEYRTKRVILEIYDEMAVAAHSLARPSAEEARFGNRGYVTRLDPSPAHPDAAHPWDATCLGPELPRDQWWQEKDEGRGMQEEANAGKEKSAASHRVKEPAPTFELKRPPAPQPKPKAKPTPSLAAQPTLITDFSPPKGSRAQRLRIVMGLGQPKNQTELQALVGALGDEDDSIRWLAGSSLTRLGGLAVVNMLAAFLQSRPGETARQEALKALGLIVDMDEDARVQESARKAMQA